MPFANGALSDTAKTELTGGHMCELPVAQAPPKKGSEPDSPRPVPRPLSCLTQPKPAKQDKVGETGKQARRDPQLSQSQTSPTTCMQHNSNCLTPHQGHIQNMCTPTSCIHPTLGSGCQTSGRQVSHSSRARPGRLARPGTTAPMQTQTHTPGFPLGAALQPKAASRRSLVVARVWQL